MRFEYSVRKICEIQAKPSNFANFCLNRSPRCGIIQFVSAASRLGKQNCQSRTAAHRNQQNMEAYRSGHNEPHSKCGCPFRARGFESHRFRQIERGYPVGYPLSIPCRRWDSNPTHNPTAAQDLVRTSSRIPNSNPTSTMTGLSQDNPYLSKLAVA